MDDYNVLTRTGPGTPCGDLMRRYWQPVSLSEELPTGGSSLSIRLLGEDLVLFRDDKDRPGLLALHCSHRGADLSYGRVEDGGLRCIYHGWLYDIHGNCLEQPGEPLGSKTCEKIRHRAYPCQERNGLIFAYLGPGEPPELPNYEFLTNPEEHVFVTKIFSECNYLQGNEGNIDLLHVSFLHYSDRDLREEGGANKPGVAGTSEALCTRGSAPQLERCEAEIVDVGLRVCKLRTIGPDREYIRVGTLVLPNLYAFPAGGLNWHVPIDDTHHWKYIVAFDRNKPYDKQALRRSRDRFTPPPHYIPVLNKANRYQQHRDSMRSGSYSGIDKWNFPAQDLCVTEGAGQIQDRTREHLMPSDQPLVIGRKLLQGAIHDVLDGRDPPALVRDPKRNRFPTIVATNGIIPSSLDWREHCRKLVDEGRGWVGRPATANTAS